LDFKAFIERGLGDYRVDDHGIVHVDEEDFYYREVPREFFDGILAAQNRDEVIAEFYDALAALPLFKRQSLRHYALNPIRAASAVLGSVGDDNVTLDYGCGWGTVTRTISRFGGTVVAMDATYESLLLSKYLSNRGNEIYIKGGRKLPLPLKSAVFDTVILNGVLEWLPEGNLLDLNPREVQVEYLKEFHRILKPGGRLIIGIENRNSFLYWAGQKEDHTGLRFGALLPRWASNLYSKAARGQPYRTYTYTRRGYRRLLSRSGFEPCRFYIPWLRYRRSHILLSENTVNTHPIAALVPGNAVLKKVARIALLLMQRLGILEHFVPDYHVIAEKHTGDGTAARLSLLETIVAECGDSLGDQLVATLSTVPTLHFSTKTRFYKIPFSDESRRRMAAEIEALKRLGFSELDLESHVLPASECGLGQDAGYAYFPRVNHVPPHRIRRNKVAELGERILDGLLADAREIRIDNTDLGKRLRSSPPREFIAEFSGDILEDRLSGLQKKMIPSGIVHGDFCEQNVLPTQAGELTVIDWDRFEACSPKVIDPLHWFIDHKMKRERMSLPMAVKQIIGGEAQPWVKSRVRSLLGELSLTEVLLLHLADRLSKDVSGHDFKDYNNAYFDPIWESSYREAFEIIGRAMAAHERSSLP